MIVIFLLHDVMVTWALCLSSLFFLRHFSASTVPNPSILSPSKALLCPIFLFKLIRLSHSDQQLSVLSGTYVSIFGPKYTTVSRASLGKVRYGEEGAYSLEAPHAELASPSCSFPHVRAQAFFEGVFVGWSWGY